MKSINHQFIQFNGEAVKRYTKSRLQPITGWRLNPENAVNTNERIEFLLATPEDNLEITPYGDGENTKIRQVRFTYEDEVLELYTEQEARSFERMNRLLIQNGLLVEYNESMPSIDKTNVLSDIELLKLAKMKTLLSFKARITEITSVYTLEKLLEVMDTVETVTNAQMKTVKERLYELKSS